MLSLPAAPTAPRSGTAPPLRLLLVDAHASVREGLRTLLADAPRLTLAGECADGPGAVALARRLRPDVILLDVALPAGDGIATIRRLRALPGAGRVLVLSSFADGPTVRRAVAAGAAGYLLKDVLWHDLSRAIVLVARGIPVYHPAVQRQLALTAAPDLPGVPRAADAAGWRLSHRERHVLGLLARGHGAGEIATALGRSPTAVRRDVDLLLGKLGVADRLQAALIGLDQHLATFR